MINRCRDRDIVAVANHDNNSSRKLRVCNTDRGLRVSVQAQFVKIEAEVIYECRLRPIRDRVALILPVLMCPAVSVLLFVSLICVTRKCVKNDRPV